MKQRELIREMYKACIEKDHERTRELYAEEMRKIIERRQQGKRLTSPKWAVVR